MAVATIARKPPKYKLTAERARELFSYDPETGELRWKPNLFGCGKRRHRGEVAGTSKNGYREIGIDGERHYAHRVAFLIMTGFWPSHQIDHESTEKFDMRWENLRDATPSQNRSNQKRRRSNTSGFKGVSKHQDGKWVAKITHQYQQIYIGLYETPEAAHAAYCEMAKALHGEFARYS